MKSTPWKDWIVTLCWTVSIRIGHAVRFHLPTLKKLESPFLLKEFWTPEYCLTYNLPASSLQVLCTGKLQDSWERLDEIQSDVWPTFSIQIGERKSDSSSLTHSDYPLAVQSVRITLWKVWRSESSTWRFKYSTTSCEWSRLIIRLRRF